MVLSEAAFIARMRILARVPASFATAKQVLTDITTAAVELIPGVDAAGVLQVHGAGCFDSLAITSNVIFESDTLQMRIGDGPCAGAARTENMVVIKDFRDDMRWPRYSQAVVRLGILSALSFTLFSSDQSLCVLNLYGYQPVEWAADDETTGVILAAHAAAVAVGHQRQQRLTAAILSSDRIGQAKGILMERFALDDVRAFEMLRALSRDTHTTLHDVADQIVNSRLD